MRRHLSAIVVKAALLEACWLREEAAITPRVVRPRVAAVSSLPARARWIAAALALVTANVANIAVETPAYAQSDDMRETRAREHFALGRFAEAAGLYGKLYAETLHPTYL